MSDSVPKETIEEFSASMRYLTLCRNKRQFIAAAKLCGEEPDIKVLEILDEDIG